MTSLRRMDQLREAEDQVGLSTHHDTHHDTHHGMLHDTHHDTYHDTHHGIYNHETAF